MQGKERKGMFSGLWGGKRTGEERDEKSKKREDVESESDDDNDNDTDGTPYSHAAYSNASHPDGALAVGCEVQIHSLTSATEHNGSRGHLIRFDAEKGRWDVCITIGQKGKVLALKPANLSLALAKESRAAADASAMAAPDYNKLEVGAMVQIHSLSTSPELNDTSGILHKFDESTGRWEVRTTLKGGATKTVALKPSNLAWLVSASDMDRVKAMRPQQSNRCDRSKANT